MQIHAGETSVGINTIPILPLGIEPTANSISEDPEHTPWFADPDAAIVDMHDESTLRFERAGDVLKYGKTILASMHHADRTVQTGGKIQARVAQKPELNHIASHPNHRRFGLGEFLSGFVCSALQHRITQIHSNASPTASGQRLQSPPRPASEVQGDGSCIGKLACDGICDLENDAAI
jgi:hypothetical protein